MDGNKKIRVKEINKDDFISIQGWRRMVEDFYHAVSRD